MRQAGFMAAAGIYALQHHVDRLAEDHQHARLIAAALEKKDFVASILPVETNLIIFEVGAAWCAKSITTDLKEAGILAVPISANQIRFVTHLDISPEMVERTIQVIERL